jgi:hypothetical protein
VEIKKLTNSNLLDVLIFNGFLERSILAAIGITGREDIPNISPHFVGESRNDASTLIVICSIGVA